MTACQPSAGGREVRPGDALTPQELELLGRAERGEVPCPWCEEPLDGEFVYFDLEEDDFYAGVRLSCSCGFVEY